MKLLFGFVLFFCISFAHGTTCYQCLTLDGWGDCAAKQLEVTCPVGKDYCAVGTVEAYYPYEDQSFTMYAKGCAAISDCWSFQISKECNDIRAQNPQAIVSCQAICCAGNKCNGASSPPVQTAKLKCYSCQSTKGWDDCVSAQKETTCTLGNDRCGSAFLHVTASSGLYAKGCVTQSECIAGAECCSGNLCNVGVPGKPTSKPSKEKRNDTQTALISNSAARQVVSVLIIAACSVVAFVC